MGFADARRILWCLRYGIGDLVMQMPALDALRRHCPDAELTAVGARPAIELLADDPRVDHLLDVSGFGITHWGDYGDEAMRAAMRDWIVERRFDTALDASHAALGFGLAVWAAGIPRIHDTGHGLENGFVARGLAGQSALCAAVREGWQVPIEPEALPRIKPAPEERAWSAQVLGGGDWVALSPVASSPLKQWPVDRLAEVAARLDEQGWRVLLLAGDGLPPRTDGPWRKLPAVSLKRTAALLAHCRLFIGNDTGLMHLAAAVGTAVIALFGPTHPHVYLPRGGRALAAPTPCRHRHVDRFGPPECVTDGHCRIGLRSCIDGIATEAVVTAFDTATGGARDRY